MLLARAVAYGREEKSSLCHLVEIAPFFAPVDEATTPVTRARVDTPGYLVT
ncbi:MAG: hypothetical protein QM702_21510 [Rubrivivax sp.]